MKYAFEKFSKHGAAVLVMQFCIAANAIAETATSSNSATPSASAPAINSSVNSSVNSVGSLMQVLFGLALVLALMLGVAWLMKRFGMARTASTQAVKLVGGVSVGSRERVLVVEVNDQWIVVGVAPGRVNALATLSKGTSGSDQVATLHAPQTPVKNFSAWLDQKMNSKKTDASAHDAS